MTPSQTKRTLAAIHNAIASVDNASGEAFRAKRDALHRDLQLIRWKLVLLSEMLSTDSPPKE